MSKDTTVDEYTIAGGLVNCLQDLEAADKDFDSKCLPLSICLVCCLLGYSYAYTYVADIRVRKCSWHLSQPLTVCTEAMMAVPLSSVSSQGSRTALAPLSTAFCQWTETEPQTMHVEHQGIV